MKISIIGSGNVATHLAINFYDKGNDIVNIFSRSIANADILAKKVDSSAIDKIDDLAEDVDIIVVSVSDDAISDIVKDIKFEPKLIVHTAGSVHIDVLNRFKNYGVVYPLQTFTKHKDVDMLSVPFCLEANSKTVLLSIKTLVSSISDNVRELTSEQRLQCHIAAVFANNFTNHMFAISEQLLSQKQISFDIIKPLIMETAKKVQNISPADAQTGPAKRGDEKTINNHLRALSSSNLEKIYSFVSNSIYNFNKNKD
jgi:predicted short-subunit dehydrogenase-like oxidoreductase (DUF2520 family)